MFKFKLLFSSICISLLCVGMVCPSAFAATLLINGDGQLYGAEDVYVNGERYDVEFVDGAAVDLYREGGVWSFTFTTEAESLAASAALLEHVFIDNDQLGLFDSDPEMTNGVTWTFYSQVFTPYKYQSMTSTIAIWATHALNKNASYGENADSTVSAQQIDYQTAMSTSKAGVYAVWKASAVPVPSTMLLLSSGIIGLAGLKRKKFSNKA